MVVPHRSGNWPPGCCCVGARCSRPGREGAVRASLRDPAHPGSRLRVLLNSQKLKEGICRLQVFDKLPSHKATRGWCPASALYRHHGASSEMLSRPTTWLFQIVRRPEGQDIRKIIIIIFSKGTPTLFYSPPIPSVISVIKCIGWSAAKQNSH